MIYETLHLRIMFCTNDPIKRINLTDLPHCTVQFCCPKPTSILPTFSHRKALKSSHKKTPKKKPFDQLFRRSYLSTNIYSFISENIYYPYFPRERLHLYMFLIFCLTKHLTLMYKKIVPRFQKYEKIQKIGFF